MKLKDKKLFILLSHISLFALFVLGPIASYSQSDNQIILSSLRSGDQTTAQDYMDQLSRVDANRLQCQILINYFYITDYESDLYNTDNMEWLLDSFIENDYPWPSTCIYRNEAYPPHCLIYGVDIFTNQAQFLWSLFEALDSLLNTCAPDNIKCIDIYNNYTNAEYVDTYLYVIERYFSEANPDSLSRDDCTTFNSWTDAIIQTHREYLELSWRIYSDLQLQSSAASLQKSLDGMQSLMGIDIEALRSEYELQLQSRSSTDSAGDRLKHEMFINTLGPFINSQSTN